MKNSSHFADILEEKIRAQETKFADSTSSWGATVEDPLPRSFAWIWGNTESLAPPANLRELLGKKAYRVEKKLLPPHLLTSAQKAAVDKIAQYGFHLTPRFSGQELKSAWRFLAKKTHPDLGGSAGEFREAQKAVEALRAVL